MGEEAGGCSSEGEQTEYHKHLAACSLASDEQGQVHLAQITGVGMSTVVSAAGSTPQDRTQPLQEVLRGSSDVPQRKSPWPCSTCWNEMAFGGSPHQAVVGLRTKPSLFQPFSLTQIIVIRSLSSFSLSVANHIATDQSESAACKDT